MPNQPTITRVYTKEELDFLKGYRAACGCGDCVSKDDIKDEDFFEIDCVDDIEEVG